MRPALIIVDMLEEFVHGRLRSPAAEAIVPRIKRLLELARSAGVPVIYLADRHYPFDHELKLWGPHAMANSAEGEIIEELRPPAGAIVLYKRSYSGFRDTGLANILRDLGVDTVMLTGIHTHICVLHTAIDAFYERFNVIVVEDAVAAFDESAHEWGLRHMKEVLGAKLIKLSEAEELILSAKGQ